MISDIFKRFFLASNRGLRKEGVPVKRRGKHKKENWLSVVGAKKVSPNNKNLPVGKKKKEG